MDNIRSCEELEEFFRDVDHTDIKTIEGEVDLRQFISSMLSYYPRWILFLYRIREYLVKILGLVVHEKPDVLPSLKAENISFNPGEEVSFFIVKKAKEDTYWVAETPEDKHLKAFFGIVAEPTGKNSTKFNVFTSVKYIHWTGPVYFNLIRPFHHMVVSSMMRNGVKQRDIT